MHAFDIFFGFIALVFVFLGIRRGFIEEVMRLAAIIIGFIGALGFYRPLVPKLSFLTLSMHMTMIVSFLIVFFCIAFGVVCVGKLLKKMIKLTMMGWLDRLCGACMGGMKAFFLGWIFVIIVSSIPAPVIHYFFKGSASYSFFVAISPALKTKALERMPAPAGALSRLPVLSDFWKKLPHVLNPVDSLQHEAPLKKKPPRIEGKKR
jgi:uncharacterized membrane protein required for colicin V production